jgi:hypothetical protein
MITEGFVLDYLKQSEFGVQFSSTVEKVILTIAERALLEDSRGFELLEQISVILEFYVEFRLRDAIYLYRTIQKEIRDFVANLRKNTRTTANTVRTWYHIERILHFLVGDGERFLEIATAEVTRLRGLRGS